MLFLVTSLSSGPKALVCRFPESEFEDYSYVWFVDWQGHLYPPGYSNEDLEEYYRWDDSFSFTWVVEEHYINRYDLTATISYSDETFSGKCAIESRKL